MTKTTNTPSETRTEATPRPWRMKRFDGLVPSFCIYGEGDASHPIARTGGLERQANAELIIRACNSFDEMLAALKIAHAALMYHPDGDTRSEEDFNVCAAVLEDLEWRKQ